MNLGLDSKHSRLLHAVVTAYIESGKPVASRYICDHFDVGLKSASVRAVMSDLETSGYLWKPHVSAGRVPTERGYRTYVDRLMHVSSIGQADLSAIRGAFLANMAVEAVLERVCRVLQVVSRQICVIIWPETRGGRSGLWVSGRADVIPQVEDLAQARLLLNILESRYDVSELLMPDGIGHGVRVVIGSENGGWPAECFSVISCTCRAGSACGAVGLVGPMRMDYPRLVALVEFAGKQLTHFLSKGGRQHGGTS